MDNFQICSCNLSRRICYITTMTALWIRFKAEETSHFHGCDFQQILDFVFLSMQVGKKSPRVSFPIIIFAVLMPDFSRAT